MTLHRAQSGGSTSSGLARSLRLPHVTALVAGTIIGATIFVQASDIAALVPSVPIILLTWTISGLLALFGALVCAELASAFPRAGGVYVFLTEEYHPLLGFLWGWTMFWIMHTGVIAVLAMVCARYTAFFVPLGDRGTRLIAVGTILVISAINYVGVRFGSTVQALFTAGKLAAIALLVVVGVAVGSHSPIPLQHAAAATSAVQHSVTLAGFLLALIAGVFTFGGWQNVTYLAEETIEPERTIPLGLVLGIAIVTVCYVALNGVYFHLLPLDRIVASQRVAADAAVAVIGTSGGAIISGLVIFSVFGAMIGSLLAAPRVYFAMARDGLLFSWVSAVHPRFRTPHRAVILQAVWASVLVWTGSYSQLYRRVIFIQWVFFALMALGLFSLRRRPNYRPAYRIWGYPWVPAVFVILSLCIVVNRLWLEPIDSAVGLTVVALGVPAYLAWRRRQQGGRSSPVSAVEAVAE